MDDFSQYQGPNPEWDALAATTDIPPFNPDLTPHQLRNATNALRAKVSAADWTDDSLDTKVSYRDYSILTRDSQNIIARVYRPKSIPAEGASPLLPVYLFFHGGGHLFGTIESEDANCGRLVANSPQDLVVVHVNYRHTPEFRHPTQVNDAWDSYEWLATNAQSLGVDTNRVVVGGVSAGGSLASWVVWNAHQLQNQGQQMPLKIVGQVLCIPWLIHPDNHPGLLPGLKAPSSYEQNVDAPVLPWAIVRLFTDLLGAEDPKDPSLNVGVASDASLKGIPKTSFVVAGRDLLRDEGLYYAKRLQENGTPTRTHVFPGLPHGFRRFGTLPSSTVYDRVVAEDIQWCLGEDDTPKLEVHYGQAG